MKAIHHAEGCEETSHPALCVQNAFHNRHYHLDQYFMRQFVKGSSTFLLVISSVFYTIRFNQRVIMKLSVFFPALPVSHYSSERPGLHISQPEEVRNEGSTGLELTYKHDSFPLNGNYTPSSLRSRTECVKESVLERESERECVCM